MAQRHLNDSSKNLDECYEPNKKPNINLDNDATNCDENDPKFTDNVSVFGNKLNENEGLGKAQFCDPMQTGQIVSDPHQSDFNRETIYRYAKGLRGTDEAVKDLFENVIVLDTNGQAHPVPLIWGSQERAVAILTQENVRKDNSLVVDRVKLPAMSIYTSDHSMNNDRYIYHAAIDYFRRLRNDGKPGLTIKENRHARDTIFGTSRGIPIDLSYNLTIWTKYWEDMNQILEQIYMKFSGGLAYIRVQGVTNWETTVRIDSIANNINTEPGDRKARVIKFQLGFTAETFIPQPISRRKAVLKSKVEFVDGLDDKDIQNIISRLEEAAGDL